jgi:hypothetical protein
MMSGGRTLHRARRMHGSYSISAITHAIAPGVSEILD